MKKTLCSALLMCCLLCTTGEGLTWAAPPPSIGEHFLGETLSYDLGVFWFGEAIHCVLNLQRGEKPGEYVATFWGKTQGFVGWLTSYRERVYLSYLQEVEGGKRFRPLRFEKRDVIGSRSWRQVHIFDYQQAQWRYWAYKKQKLVSQWEKELPGEVGFEDILSAFYNFRYGRYGSIAKDQDYTLVSFSGKESYEYKVRVLSQEEQEQSELELETAVPKDYLLQITVNKEIFGTKEGILWVWLSSQGIPLGGVAEDAIGFGDLYGDLQQVELAKEDPTAFIPSFLHLKALLSPSDP